MVKLAKWYLSFEFLNHFWAKNKTDKKVPKVLIAQSLVIRIESFHLVVSSR